MSIIDAVPPTASVALGSRTAALPGGDPAAASLATPGLPDRGGVAAPAGTDISGVPGARAGPWVATP